MEPPDLESLIPSSTQRKIWKLALTGAAVLALLCMAVFVVSKLIGILDFLEPVLLPVFIAAALAYLLEPLVQWLRRHKFNRKWAVITVMGGVVLGIVTFICVIFPPLVRSTDQMIQNREAVLEKAVNWFDQTIETPILAQGIDMLYRSSLRNLPEKAYSAQELESFKHAANAHEKLGVCLTVNSSYLQNKIINWLGASGQVFYRSINVIIGIIIVPVFLGYFLYEAKGIKEKWSDVLPLRISRFKQDVIETLEEINKYLIAFFRGQMLVSIIEGVLIGIGLKLLGLPYAVTIGVALCTVGIIPYIGFVIVFIPALLLAWYTWGDWQHVVYVSAIFIGVNQFDNWVVQPRIVGHAVGLHSLTILFSVLIWTLILGGVLGAVLAVPLTAAIKVIYQRYIWKRAPELPSPPAS